MRTSQKPQRLLRDRKPKGVSLAEVVVSTLLIGLVMVAALASVGSAARSTTAATQGSDGFGLARELLEEITVLPYTDTNQPPVFGVEAGETGSPGVRSAFDDLDDYKDWNDSPPKNRAGVPLIGFTGWSRTSDVEKIDNANYSVLSDGSTDKALRRITVTVTSPAGKVTTVQAYRSQAAGSLQSQGIDQTLITWVGVSIQAGSGTPVSSGISLINHAADQ